MTNNRSFRGSALDFSNWTKVEKILVAKATDNNSRLQLTTTTKGVIWLDQVSAMPLDTYKVVLHPEIVYISYQMKYFLDPNRVVYILKKLIYIFSFMCLNKKINFHMCYLWKLSLHPWGLHISNTPHNFMMVGALQMDCLILFNLSL